MDIYVSPYTTNTIVPSRTQSQKLCFFSALLAIFLSTSVTVMAEQELTRLLGSKAFRGSMEVVNKLNWVGFLLNTVISVFCLIGLSMLMYQRIVTIMYIAVKNTWDNVYDLKSESNQGAWFGIPGMGKEVFTGKRGMGLDAIVGFLYMLLPNIKSYSDYNPAKPLRGLNEDEDTALQYMLKTLPVTVIVGFFLTIGFSGTLTKGYGMLIDGIAVAMDTAVELNFEGWVKRTLSIGGGHTFTLGTDGSATGKLGENIARDMYSKTVSRLDVVDENSKLQIGKNCEAWVIENVLGGSTVASERINAINEIAQSAVVEGATDTLATQIRTDADVKSSKYQVECNAVDYMGSADSPVGKTVAMGELIEGTNLETSENNTELYLHVMILKGKITEANYYAPSAENAGTTGTP